MKIFFDTEFTQLRKDTTLISIGLISEDNQAFYAEFTDYNKNLVTPWIQENVIDHLYLGDPKNEMLLGMNEYANPIFYTKGNTQKIANQLRVWLYLHFDKIQFVSDVSHYDFVLLIDLLWKDALKMPDFVCAYCHDINQDIAQYYKISDADAFNYSREKILTDHNCSLKDNKHNSLYDAIVMKKIYEIINGGNKDAN
jgi:hypothetical protein